MNVGFSFSNFTVANHPVIAMGKSLPRLLVSHDEVLIVPLIHLPYPLAFLVLNKAKWYFLPIITAYTVNLVER